MEKSVHTTDYSRLRAELRAVREAAQLSQRELANKLNVPHSWVAKVESGERRIDPVEFTWIVIACGDDPLASFSRVFPRGSKKQPRRGSGGGQLR